MSEKEFNSIVRHPDDFTFDDLKVKAANMPNGNLSKKVCDSDNMESRFITNSGTSKRCKVFTSIYYGSITLDRRYTPAMLPWLVAEVKRRGRRGRDVQLEVKEHILKCHCANGNLWFEHKLNAIYRFMQTSHDKKCFAYLIKDLQDAASQHCYVFEASDELMVQDLFAVIRESSRDNQSSQSPIQANPSLSSSSSSTTTSSSSLTDNGNQRFELLYVGKIKVSHRKPPPTFIDEAVEKFKILEMEKLKHFNECGGRVSERQRHGSGTSIASLPPNLDHFVSIRENELEEQVDRMGGSGSSDRGSTSGSSSVDSLALVGHPQRQEVHFGNVEKFDKNARDSDEHFSVVHSARSQMISEENVHLRWKSSGEWSPVSSSSDVSLQNSRIRSCSFGSDFQRSRSNSIAHGQNRTMVFQIGKTEISLISLDKKSIILNKSFKDISHCSQGIKHMDHFGFICRDANADSYLGYILKCQSEVVTEEILTTLKQVFASAAAQQRSLRNQFLMCESCPMLWLHKLCLDLEGLTASKAYGVILKKLESLSAEEKSEILAKLQGAEVTSTQEQNEILMMLLRALCETKQAKHSHVDSQGKHEILGGGLFDKKHQSVLDDLKNKAKRSLTNSFENILKRKTRDEAREAFRERSNTIDGDSSSYQVVHDCVTPESSPSSTPDRKETNYDFLEGYDENNPVRRRSSIGLPHDCIRPEQGKKIHPHSRLIKQRTSPMMNIFMKVGNPSKPCTPTDDEKVTPSKTGSWRQAIFNRVVTPQHKTGQAMSHTPPPHKSLDSIYQSPDPADQYVKRSPAALRSLWKKAIKQQILLIRMEKENKKLKANQDAVQVKRQKLSYEEITPCLKEITKVWEGLLSKDRPLKRIKLSKLVDAVKSGVPRPRRGEIWQFLATQHNLNLKGRRKSSGDLSSPYEDLLKQLTAQQHAILIDLGRTFPNHPYFSSPLGAGQLSLFNLLKAYSLLDKEVGYCQGLSFIAGILLLHMEEEDAFKMLKHILFTLEFRSQFKPDMIALQIQMYQLSRLIHDRYPELYEHFEKHEIAPTLYAAPWFLTLFASQFPLGFVARVFDLIFLYGLEVIFKVSLVLLGNHRELIIQCSSFESVMDFLKTTLPSMGIIQMERTINQVFTLDISKQLHAYEVEYHVLQEEMIASPQSVDKEVVDRLEAANKNLKLHNQELLDERQAAQNTIQCLERNISSYQACTSRQESQLKTLEMEKMQLLQVVEALRKNWPSEKYEICSDIISQYKYVLRAGSPPLSPHVYHPSGVARDALYNRPSKFSLQSFRSQSFDEEGLFLRNGNVGYGEPELPRNRSRTTAENFS